MSIYSGKCDLADHIEINNDRYLKYDYYVGKNAIIPLRVNSLKDLVPYYPYLISMSGWRDNHGIVILSSDSFVDEEERDHLTWMLDRMKKAYRAAKRKKIEFVNPDPVFTNSEEIFKRVKESGENATIDGIHTHFANMCRDALIKEMINVGYSADESVRWVWKNDWNQWDKEFQKYKGL